MSGQEIPLVSARFLLAQAKLGLAYLDIAELPGSDEEHVRENVSLAQRKLETIDRHLKNAEQIADVCEARDQLHERLRAFGRCSSYPDQRGGQAD